MRRVRFSKRMSGAHVPRRSSRNGPLPRTKMTSIATRPTPRAIPVAQADPATPIAGRPRWPKISAQASPAFSTLVHRVTVMGVLLSPAPRSAAPAMNIPNMNRAVIEPM